MARSTACAPDTEWWSCFLTDHHGGSYAFHRPAMYGDKHIARALLALALASTNAGCGASPAPVAPPPLATTGGEVPEVDEREAQRAHAEREAQARRIRELESRLALHAAESDQLRRELESRAEPDTSPQRDVVTLGDTRRARPAPPPPDDVEEVVEGDEGPRPMLRLYGPVPAESFAFGPPAEAPRVAASMPASLSMPAALPMGTLGALPVMPGGSAAVPAIPHMPMAVSSLPPAPMASLPPAPTATPSIDAGAQQYRAALALVTTRRFDEALSSLEAFVLAHPRHAYADNAQYWRGEILFLRHDFAASAAQFETMVRLYPRGNKVPDALLRLGTCYERMGQAARARDVLRRLRTEHPGTVAARLANREET